VRQGPVGVRDLVAQPGRERRADDAAPHLRTDIRDGAVIVRGQPPDLPGDCPIRVQRLQRVTERASRYGESGWH